MLKTKMGLIISVTMFLCLLTIHTAVTVASERVELKAVTFLPSDTPIVFGFHMFKDKVNEAKGPVSIRYLGGPEVIPMFEQTEAVRSGSVDAAWVPCAYYRKLVPEANTIMLSHLAPWEERKSGLHDYMIELHKKKLNSFYIGRQLVYAPFTFFGKEPSKSPADLKGRKLRAGALYDTIYKQMGIVGVTMTHGDTYGALEKGILDGVGSNFGDVVKFRWFEVSKYIYSPPFWKTNNVVLLVNLDRWNKLSKEQKDLLLQSQIAIEKPMWEHFKTGSDKMLQTMLDNGMKPSQWSQNDQNWFLDMIDKVQWEKEAETIGKEEIAKLKKMMGYKE